MTTRMTNRQTDAGKPLNFSRFSRGSRIFRQWDACTNYVAAQERDSVRADLKQSFSVG
jgi:hypothetical protein